MNNLTLILKQASLRQREIQKEINMLKLVGQDENSRLRELTIESRINENLKLVIKISEKFEGIDKDVEELFAIGLVGLVKAAQKFDESRQVKFSTFGGRCVENEILMYFRKEKPRTKHTVSLESPIAIDDEGNETTIQDILTADVNVEKIIYEKEFVNRVRELVSHLPYRQNQAAIRRFTPEKDKTKQKNIYEIYGISSSYMSKLEKMAMDKLKPQLTREGYEMHLNYVKLTK